MARLTKSEISARRLQAVLIKRIKPGNLDEITTSVIISSIINLIKSEDKSGLLESLLIELESRDVNDLPSDIALKALTLMLNKTTLTEESDMSLSQLEQVKNKGGRPSKKSIEEAEQLDAFSELTY